MHQDLWTITFGFKATPEVERDGQVGLILRGYATKFNEVDHELEVIAPDALGDIAQTWFAEAEPLILYEHGTDPDITTRRIGKALDYTIDDTGLYVEVFIPKEPEHSRFPAGSRAAKAFRRMYDGIAARAIRGFSIMGARVLSGGVNKRWSMLELTVTKRPCLDSAQYVLGTKSIADMWGGLPMMDDYGSALVAPDSQQPRPQTEAGHIARPDWNRVMDMAQKANDRGLHDHLLHGKPTEFQGTHDSETCATCKDRRTSMGIKGWAFDQQSPFLTPATPPPTEQTDAPAETDPAHDNAVPLSQKAQIREQLLADPALMADVQALLTISQKAGARHSKATLDAVKQTIKMLEDVFGLSDNEDSETDTSTA
jgi:phage head maturation protease